MALTSKEGTIARINEEYGELEGSHGLNSFAVAVGQFAPTAVNVEAVRRFYEKVVTLDVMKLHDKVAKIQQQLAQTSDSQRPQAFHKLLNQLWLEDGLLGVNMFTYDMVQIEPHVSSVNPFNFKVDYPQQDALHALESINGQNAYSQAGVNDSIHGPQTIQVPAKVEVADGIITLRPVPYESEDGHSMINPQDGKTWGDGWEKPANHHFGVNTAGAQNILEVNNNMWRGYGSILDVVSFTNPNVKRFPNWQATKQQVLLTSGQPMTHRDIDVLQSMYDRFNPPAVK